VGVRVGGLGEGGLDSRVGRVRADRREEAWDGAEGNAVQ
jgi:hypothetical protein